jgi:tetratricopeptide (TPR) repeat protein
MQVAKNAPYLRSMKSILTLFASTVVLFASAQDHVYEDLLVMFVDEKYEKCLAKAESYTLKEDTKKDAMPYLYMSMCMYEMSKLEKFQADYPKAFREAMKLAEKYRKKDKNNEFFDNYEDYWTKLNTSAMEEGDNLFEAGEYSKAKQLFDNMVGYDPGNPGAWLMLALCQQKSNLAKEAELSLKAFGKAYNAVGDPKRMAVDRKTLLRKALIRYTAFTAEKGLRDSARRVIDLGKGQFMDDPEYKLQYEEVH